MAEAREPLLQSFDKEPLGDHESLSPPPYHSPPKRKRFADGLPLALLESLAVLALGASTAAICIWYFCYGISNPTVPDQTNTLTSCPCTDALPIKAPRPNPWTNLNVEEATALRSWLMEPERGLNLTWYSGAQDTDNYIHFVETYKPPKNVTLAYLQDPSVEVPRYARAVVDRGADDVIVDYLIGPLPLSKDTTVRPLTEIYHQPSIPLNARSTFNWTNLGRYMAFALEPLNEVTLDLYGGVVGDKVLAVAGTGPMSYDGTWRRSWLQLRWDKPGGWLRPIDFYVYTDFTGTDPTKYKVLRILHDGKTYNTMDEVKAAWRNGTLKRASPEPSDWSSRAIKGKRRDLDDRAGPRRVMFDGPRYRLDRKEQYITWMGWALYLSFERDMGLHLWDINFRGERIIYELSPQEAMAQYSGIDPHQASTVWLDRAFGMGSNVRELILGYDCPADAILLNATVHESGSSTRRNAICIFESDKHIPLSRHTERGKNVMGAVRGHELVVRTISTVGNYDYIFDYTFQLDGSIEIRLSASGYLQGAVWTENSAEYGHAIHRDNMGSLHDHVINYKVDFDIAGIKNSLMQVKLEVEEREVDWLDPEWGSTLIQQKITRNLLSEESLLSWPVNGEGTYVVTNEAAKNAWGNSRGYVIHPGPLCRLTNLRSKRTENNVNWAKQHLAVSVRKEEEPSSSSPWNINLPGRAPVDFYKFFNNESISQEDLVVWLNLGTHHIPRAEDSPNTLTNMATSYVLLSPWNFNDYDVAMESRNSVLLNNDGDWIVEEAVKSPRCIPGLPGPVRYHGIDGWDEHGEPLPRDSNDYQQWLAQSNHGMRAWL